MAAELKQRFSTETKFIKGAGGIFDVRVDGELVFSKHAVNRFPEPGEVESTIAGMLKDG
ncbi:MAG: Rdx family protein [Thermoanaerobaculales bacterium]|nr:Rdx family protein [Thermoanaerobaculales bacterium]